MLTVFFICPVLNIAYNVIFVQLNTPGPVMSWSARSVASSTGEYLKGPIHLES
jgi:hypothetical protein